MWEGHNARALIPLDIRTIDDKPLHASETNLHLPSVRMASVFGTSQFVERLESSSQTTPQMSAAIFFATEGDAVFFHSGGHIALPPRPGRGVRRRSPVPSRLQQPLPRTCSDHPETLFCSIIGKHSIPLPAVFEFGPQGPHRNKPSHVSWVMPLNTSRVGSLRHLDFHVDFAGDFDSAESSAGQLLEEEAGLIRNVLGEGASS